jgi:hypothetical protein
MIIREEGTIEEDSSMGVNMDRPFRVKSSFNKGKVKISEASPLNDKRFLTHDEILRIIRDKNAR